MMKLHFENLDVKLAGGLLEIAPQFDIAVDEKGIKVKCEKGEHFFVGNDKNEYRIVYRYPSEFFRALSLLSRVKNGGEVTGDTAYSGLCYMADMSRNAVFNVNTAKKMIRYLATMGYTSMMLYTEDTYQIPEYESFGRMRGRFSQEELRELDNYAESFGIELVPCVQALAHLGSIFRWAQFSGINDVDDILCVGDPKTYELIENSLRSCAASFRSRKINLGMDEAHMLGLGRYLKKFGFRKSSEIMLEHLGKVVELCRKYGFKPMIWSDMFFRMQFGGRYYVSSGEIGEEVRAKVPKDLTLIYWDYYTRDKNMISHMARCHKQFGTPVAFAGGVWKWTGMTPHNKASIVTSENQIIACLENGINDMIVTGWGDDGAEASEFSILAGLLYWAERGYGNVGTESLDRRANECFGISYQSLLDFDLPDELPGIDPIAGERISCVNPSKYLLFNDPIEGLMDAHLDPATAPAAYAKIAEKLSENACHPAFGLAFDTAAKLCRLLSHKCDLSIRIRNAYLADDRKTLSALAEKEIPCILTLLEEYTAAFRKQWYNENKTYGFGIQEIRLGGLRERLISAKMRLEGYLAGEIPSIDELKEPVLTANGNTPTPASPYIQSTRWRVAATACVISH